MRQFGAFHFRVTSLIYEVMIHLWADHTVAIYATFSINVPLRIKL